MQAIIKLPFYQISIVAIFYATSRLRNESFCSSLRDNRWLSNQLRHTAKISFARVAFFSLFRETFQRFSSDEFCLIQITKFSLENFHVIPRKIPSQSRSRQNIYLSELTNEYWNVKHESKKFIEIFFSAASEAVPNRCAAFVLVYVWVFTLKLFCFMLWTRSIEY